jgi:hypothetical protein
LPGQPGQSQVAVDDSCDAAAAAAVLPLRLLIEGSRGRKGGRPRRFRGVDAAEVSLDGNPVLLVLLLLLLFSRPMEGSRER